MLLKKKEPSFKCVKNRYMLVPRKVPSAMVTSPNKSKGLEWDKKLQTNTLQSQTKVLAHLGPYERKKKLNSHLQIN